MAASIAAPGRVGQGEARDVHGSGDMPAPRYGSVPDDAPWIPVRRSRTTPVPTSGARTRVLLVAPDVMLGFALVGVLEGHFDVELARDATRALQILSTTPFDVVLVDEDLPGRRGPELLAEIRQRHPRVRRLLMTGDATGRPPGETTWDHALQKPFELEELLENVAPASVRASLAG